MQMNFYKSVKSKLNSITYKKKKNKYKNKNKEKNLQSLNTASVTFSVKRHGLRLMYS